MNETGPILETLTHRLADIPMAFLAAPRIGGKGLVHTAALVNDLLAAHGTTAPLALLNTFAVEDNPTTRNWLALAGIVVWLLADDWFMGAAVPQQQLISILDADASALAAVTPAHDFVNDPDRREELARVVLARLGARPAGETEAQAADRLTSISGIARKRMVEANRAAAERARLVREALARKAAEEAADKWSRD